MKKPETILTLIIFVRKHAIVFMCFAVFLILLFRDPFSQRTLIPNFEPFPDTIHYVNPALSLLKGQGLQITREGRGFYPNVPPLYSLTLMPIYAVNSDPRMFYFTNVVLSISSFLLFCLVLKKLFKNTWITGFSLFLFATNYYLYWYPTLAMAENLTIFLFIAATYLLVLKPTAKTSLLAGLLASSFFATKYASLPLTLTFAFLYGVYIFFVTKDKNLLTKLLLIFLSVFVVSFLSIISYEYFVKGNNFGSIIGLVADVFSPANLSTLTQKHVSPVIQKNSWFSILYLKDNLRIYINSLLGNPERFLWQYEPLLPKIFSIFSLMGLFFALLTKKIRFLSISLIIMLATSILFIATFYTADIRYVNFATPILILGFGFFLEFIYIHLEKKYYVFFYLLLLMFVGIYSASSYKRLRMQVAINLKYAETPWYYISVLKLNDYFKDPLVDKTKKPIVISALAPYFIDFYSNGNYRLLPLHSDQEFRHVKQIAWGSNNYSNLIDLYKRYLAGGYKLYIHNYGLGNEDYLRDAFKNVEKNFKLQLVAQGCYDLCNIYKLEQKE